MSKAAAAAHEAAHAERMLEHAQSVHARMRLELRELFTFIDTLDGVDHGHIELRLFLESVRNEARVRDYLDINDVEEALSLWKRIDTDGSKTVDKNEFIEVRQNAH